MALASWFCAKSTKNMVVKIVYPGGQVEIHDRPILAAEIMQRNPKCCITYPSVFRDPSAVVSPDTELLLGQKFYDVPISTLRKLQRLSRRSTHSLRAQNHCPCLTPRHPNKNKNTPKSSFGCLKQSDVEVNGASLDGSSRSSAKIIERQKETLDDGCFKCLIAISKIKPGKEETHGIRNRENVIKKGKGCPTRLGKNAPSTTPSYHWQPGLDSISEE